ncbi:hypothetical protein BV898_08491 [Hypsibius exemplaris]|uniref:ZP domain-containing protein n=1 Tax=Hypsibius exemplaris TaxID=2072580 RepID=A0A1W0WQA9_HYPEX|nr:hypothetical protein BV898_08491 [Hypsibius exemplaris]
MLLNRYLLLGVIFILFVVSCHSGPDRVGVFFRIEVNFTRFENPQSQTHDGYYCDSMSACDPQIYAFIELIYEPPASSPKPSEKFVLVHSQCCANVYNMTTHNQIVKTICQVGRHPIPKRVSVKVEVRDKDLFTPNDMIEQFNCQFPFTPLRKEPTSWSQDAACQPLHGPHQIRLYYRFRIYSIYSTECFVPF